jgi:hypothetical protein
MNIDILYEELLRDIEITHRCAKSIKDECYERCTNSLTSACNRVYYNGEWSVFKKEENFENIVKCLDIIRLEVHKKIIKQRRGKLNGI